MLRGAWPASPSRTPRIRLTAARALESLAEPGAFEAFVAGLVNDRGDKPEWKIAAPTVDAFAELLVHGEPQLRARTARLFARLNEKEQAAFDQAWSVHEARYRRRARRAAPAGQGAQAGPAAVHEGTAPRAGLRGLRRAGPRAGRLDRVRVNPRGGRSRRWSGSARRP